jgi:hypothetical protein
MVGEDVVETKMSCKGKTIYVASINKEIPHLGQIVADELHRFGKMQYP